MRYFEASAAFCTLPNYQYLLLLQKNFLPLQPLLINPENHFNHFCVPAAEESDAGTATCFT